MYWVEAVLQSDGVYIGLKLYCSVTVSTVGGGPYCSVMVSTVGGGPYCSLMVSTVGGGCTAE